jgi:hypothetical protein
MKMLCSMIMSLLMPQKHKLTEDNQICMVDMIQMSMAVRFQVVIEMRDVNKIMFQDMIKLTVTTVCTQATDKIQFIQLQISQVFRHQKHKDL